MQSILNFDYQIFQAINSLSGKWQILDWIGIFCAKYLIFVIAGIVVIWWLAMHKTKPSNNWPIEGKRKWLVFGTISLSVVASVLVNQILATLKFRERPFLTLNINKLVEPFSEKSFPSDHATVAFAISMAVFFYNKKLGSILMCLSFLIALGRIFAGVHYPVDVIAGAVLGMVASLIVYKIFFCKTNKCNNLSTN